MSQVQLKPYSVSRGKPFINWWEELKVMRQIVEKEYRDRTAEEKKKLNYLARQASDWVTCACGNQCEIIPRDNRRFGLSSNPNAAPKDNVLADLGVKFYSDVSLENVNAAEETLQKIEERSAYLIKEELKKRNGTGTT